MEEKNINNLSRGNFKLGVLCGVIVGVLFSLFTVLLSYLCIYFYLS